MADRDELAALRRLAELEAKAKPAPNPAGVMPRMDPTEGMGFTSKFNAGIGKALSDLGGGAAQLVGMGPSSEEVRETKRLDAPLMKTPSGMAGNIAGNIAAFAPLAVVPGANTVAGAGALGAVSGAFQPTEGAGDRLKNMAVGGGLGAGTQALAGPGAQRVGEWAAGREAQAAARKSQNAVRDQTLREGQALGLTVPPSAVNQSAANDVLESIGGKAAINQQAAKRNQPVVDAVLRREAGLQPNDALSEQALKASRKSAAAPYRELTAISPQAASDMEALKAARLDSKLNWQHYGRGGDPASYKAASQADQLAEALEQSLEQHAAKIGRPELVEAMRNARVQIAKTHTVEKAVNVGTGSGDAAVLGSMLDRGAPLSGDLRKVAAFQQAFKQPMREGTNVPNPGSSKLAAVLSGGLGAGGMATAGPAGLAAAALPFTAPPAARSIQLARGRTVQPDYAVSPLTKGAAALSDPETRRRIALLARGLALPAAATPSN